ncbi:Uncharacterized protein XB16_0220 [Leptospira santarosai]|uniref:Uncharacterized protein n=1 Tax=Leptospira santarosai TaxID=28183 RepID=A0A2P1QNT7_9LEPT|nr:Uncharacterized protein XB16_0220 [Leptospira santarosai]
MGFIYSVFLIYLFFHCFDSNVFNISFRLLFKLIYSVSQNLTLRSVESSVIEFLLLYQKDQAADRFVMILHSVRMRKLHNGEKLKFFSQNNIYE